MSTNSGDDAVRAPGLMSLGQDSEGREMLAMPYDEDLAQKAVEKGLASKTEPTPEADDNTGETPDPEAEAEPRDGGPIRRFNDIFTDLGSVQLEAIGLDGNEIANSTATLRNEMYRSRFPIVQARFVEKCADDGCGAEYDEEVGFCVQCAREEMKEHGVDNPPTDPEEIPEEFREHQIRGPNPTEKRQAERLAESVNKEGQSLRELMKMEEDDQSRLGVSTIIVKKDYAVAAGDTGIYSRGEIIHEEVDQIIRGDPKRVVPVVDENGRVGNYWYTCPIHREDSKVTYEEYHHEYKRRCDDCGAELREVFFVEKESTTASRRRSARKYYFEDEVVTWARYYPRLHGLDGLSPTHHVWLKQAILHWMDIYGAAFYDPESDRYPNKFMVVHTTNPRAWEQQFERAEEDTRENPYNEQIMMNEYSGESNTTPEVQVIDLMNDELMGQDQQIRDQYKQDIRTNFGVTNVFDSELEDAGGLNNEGLQLEVTDRSIASAMHDTEAGPLDELAKLLGIEDHRWTFVPPQDTDIEDLKQQIEVGEKAVGAGLDARLEDNKAEVADGEFEESEDEGGGLGGLLGAAEDPGTPAVTEKAVGDDPWSADTRLFRVVPSEDDDTEYKDDVLGVGVDFPESGVYVDWHLEAFPDELDEPHVSDYGSMSDLRKATNNDIVDVMPPRGATQKGDPMANGHDLDPATGKGTCENTGKDIEAETMQDLTEDCPHCGEPLSVLSTKADVDAIRLHFPPGGEVLDHEEGDWEQFLDDLHEHAGVPAQQTADGWLEHPEDDLGTHDAATYVMDADQSDVEMVLANHPAVHYEIDTASIPEHRRAGGDDAKADAGPEPDTENPEKHDGTDRTPSKSGAGGDAERKRRAEEDEEGNGRWLPAQTKAEWVPYEGPQGGVGWKNPESGEVTYDDEPPGQVSEEHEALGEAMQGLDEDTQQRAINTLFDLETESQGAVMQMMPKLTNSTAMNVLELLANNGPDVLNTMVAMLGEFGDGPENTKSVDEDKLEDIRKLDDAFQHIVWADETNKAEPFWDEDDMVPDFVKEIISDIAPDVVWSDFESIPGALQETMVELLEENLTQPQGWSLSSIADDISTEFGVAMADAELVARTETAKVLNEAREEGYERAGALDEEERRFKWLGPHDHRTTDACRWLKQVTGETAGRDMINKHGAPRSVDTVGEAVTYDELIALEKEAAQKFFPSLDWRKHVIHPNERHTFVETFDHKLHTGQAAPIQVEYKMDWSPAMAAAGTFVMAT